MEDDNNTASKLMNDEIKEIIRKRKQKIELNKSLNVQGYYDKEDKALLDYITNLQHTEDLYNQLLKDYDELEQAYQELKDSKQWWNNRFNAVQRDYEDYKSRIEKAVEYIKEMDTQLEVYGDYDILSDNKNDLLNILNGRSDE